MFSYTVPINCLMSPGKFTDVIGENPEKKIIKEKKKNCETSSHFGKKNEKSTPNNLLLPN